jgi:hypothetical protein
MAISKTIVIILAVLLVLALLVIIVYRLGHPRVERVLVPYARDIDAVITFVNDQDKLWEKQKQKYLKTSFDPGLHNHDSIHPNRFHNRDELRFCLRSIEAHAPWIRNVYLVVSGEGQIPEWINRACDRIKIVTHGDFMSVSHLPTFNSHAIEANLHRIRRLSPIFIYLNDDLFFGRPTTRDDFIAPDGKLKIYLKKDAISPTGIPVVTESGHSSNWKNVNAYLDKKYKVESREKMEHCGSMLRRDLIGKIWDDLGAELETTSKQKFRSIKDYAVTCALHPYVAIYQGLAVRAEAPIMYMMISDDNGMNEMTWNNIKEAKPLMFCLNDVSDDQPKNIDVQIRDFLEDYFPETSAFELPEENDA